MHHVLLRLFKYPIAGWWDDSDRDQNGPAHDAPQRAWHQLGVRVAVEQVHDARMPAGTDSLARLPESLVGQVL
jgi:hypothetical protein